MYESPGKIVIVANLFSTPHALLATGAACTAGDLRTICLALQEIQSNLPSNRFHLFMAG
jgi:hypothetical protein